MWHRFAVPLFLFLQFQCISTQIFCKKTKDLKDFYATKDFSFYDKKELPKDSSIYDVLPILPRPPVKSNLDSCKELCQADEKCEGFFLQRAVCYFCGYGAMCPIYHFEGLDSYREQSAVNQLCYLRCHKNRDYPNFVPAKTIYNFEEQWISCKDGYHVGGTDGETGFTGVCQSLIYYKDDFTVQCVENINIPNNDIPNNDIPNKMPAVCPFFHASQWCFFLTICLGFLQY